MNGHATCLLYGAIISFVVSALKRIPFVKKHPKPVAAVLSATAAVVTTFFTLEAETPVAILVCFAEQFAAAVTTHEAVVEPIKDKVV